MNIIIYNDFDVISIAASLFHMYSWGITIYGTAFEK